MEKDDMSLRVDSFSCYLDTAKEKAMSSSSSLPTKPPPPFTSIMFSKSQDSQLANLRVDSLSTYLNSAGDAASNFVFEIPGPVEDPTSAFTFSREVPKDGEIGVFNADRYFNMKLEYKKEPKMKYEGEARPQAKPKAPSSCFSEVSSSWNSQTALVPDKLPRIGSQKHKRALGRKIFMGFGCKGPCFDKKSVADFSSKPARTGSERVHDHRNMITAEKNRIKIEHLDESRPSIEVFGSSNRMKGDIATKLERKLSMLTWDAIPKDKTVIPTPPSPIVCDDMASEASSDLFEIENISGSTNFQRGDDTCTCMSPSSYYAPSEASIQWSVVTASAAGYSEFNNEASVSVAGDLILRNVKSTNNNKSAKTKFEGAQKTRAGGILGCKNQRAVDVVVCQKSGLDTPKHNQVKDSCADITLKLPRTLAINGGHSYPILL